MDWGRLFFTAKGRIAPPTFWAGFGVLTVVSVATIFVPVVGGLLWLATCFPWAMLNAKRLHDLGLSGWVQMVQFLGNAALVVVAFILIGGASMVTVSTDAKDALDAALATGAIAGFLMSGGVIIFNTLWLIWLGGSPGKPQENRYGRPTNWP